VVAGVFGWLLGCCYVVTRVLRDTEIASVAVQLLSVLNETNSYVVARVLLCGYDSRALLVLLCS